MVDVEHLWPSVASSSCGNAQFLARQDAIESNARTYARRIRVAIIRAKGVIVEDADGRNYFDCLAAAGTLALGHSHPVVVAAIKRAVDEGVPLQTLDMVTPVKDAFTEALISSLPGTFARRAKIHYCGPAGTDAVEAAIKLVVTATGGRTMLTFRGGYHGMTQGALSMMGNLSPKAALPTLLPGGQFLPYPYEFRCPFGLGGEATARLSAAQTRSLLADPEGGVHPAGLITEIVQGEGGVIPAPDSWVREIRSITKEYKVPLIFDEVQTGWGRTGMLYALEHAGVAPDVLVLSKAIGGGLPLSVIIYDQSLDVWAHGPHAGTFRGNQLAMAAGLATLRVIEEQGLVAHANVMGQRMQTHLRSIQREYSFIGDVRGRGLMVGVEIVDPESARDSLGNLAASGDQAAKLQQICLRKGLIVELGGRHASVLRFLPPLIITAEQIDSVCSIFGEACRVVEGTALKRPLVALS